MHCRNAKLSSRLEGTCSEVGGSVPRTILDGRLLMRKPKVEPLVTSIISRCKIVLLLIFRKRPPDLVPSAVDPDVEYFRADEENDVITRDPNQRLITSIVIGLISGSIYLCGISRSSMLLGTAKNSHLLR